MPSWQDLEKPKPEPKTDEFSELCARVFATPDGRALLQMLRRMTFERVLPGDPAASALYGLEGQRQLVRRIEGAIERGLAMLDKGKDGRTKSKSSAAA